MHKLLAVGLGGFVGAIARYVLTLWMIRIGGRDFPWGTLLVNVLGCLLIGVLMQLALQRAWFSESLRLLLVTGFLGSLTTFSSLSFETLELVERGEWFQASGNVFLNLALGFAAVLAGRALVTH
jgi:fluoride exporter